MLVLVLVALLPPGWAGAALLELAALVIEAAACASRPAGAALALALALLLVLVALALLVLP